MHNLVSDFTGKSDGCQNYPLTLNLVNHDDIFIEITIIPPRSGGGNLVNRKVIRQIFTCLKDENCLIECLSKRLGVFEPSLKPIEFLLELLLPDNSHASSSFINSSTLDTSCSPIPASASAIIFLVSSLSSRYSRGIRF